MGHLSLALALPLLGTLGSLELATGVEGDTSAGLMAVMPDRPSVPAMDATLTLLSGMRVISDGSNFTLAYRPRYYYQIPNVAGQSLPLFLHQLATSYQADWTKRASFRWAANGSLGAMSYASLLDTFPAGTAATITSSGFIPLGTASTNASFSYRTSQINNVSIGGNMDYRTLVGAEDANEQMFPTTFNVGLQLSDAVQLSARDLVVFNLASNFVLRDADDMLPGGTTVGGRANNAIANASLSWGRDLSQRTTLTGAAGVAMGGLTAGASVSAFPTFSIGIRNSSNALNSRWVTDFMAGERGFLDPILGTFRPQGFLSYGLSGQHGRYWSSRTALEMALPLAQKPMRPMQYESGAGCSFALYYQLARGFSANASVQWRLRASHWKELDALQTQNQLTGGVGFRYTFGTDQTTGGWL